MPWQFLEFKIKPVRSLKCSYINIFHSNNATCLVIVGVFCITFDVRELVVSSHKLYRDFAVRGFDNKL